MAITAGMVKELREITSAAMMDCKKALVECDGDMEAAKELLRKKGQATANKKSSRETKEGAIAIASSDAGSALVKIACETDFVAINDLFKQFIAGLAEQALEVGVENFEEQTSSKGSIKEQFIAQITKLGENMSCLNGVKFDAADGSVIGTYVHSNGKIGVMIELAADGGDLAKIQTAAKDICMHIAASQVEAVSAADLDPAVLEKEKAFLIDQAKESGKPDNIIEKMVMGRIQKFKKEICLLDQAFVKQPDISIAGLLEQVGKDAGTSITVKRFHKETF